MSIIGGALSNSAGRSREGAWIEIGLQDANDLATIVAPARERGLKFCFGWFPADVRKSLPRGSVD